KPLLYPNERIGITTVLYNLIIYSHSIVAGGFELMSYTTLLIPRTLLIISLETLAKKSYGKCAQSAVMPSTEVTARNATVNSYVLSSPITPTLCTGSRMVPACHTLLYSPVSFKCFT